MIPPRIDLLPPPPTLRTGSRAEEKETEIMAISGLDAGPGSLGLAPEKINFKINFEILSLCI